MSRSKWKFNYYSKTFFKTSLLNFLYLNLRKKRFILFNRASHNLKNIPTVYIHKGNTFIRLANSKFFENQKLGIFSFTRRPYVYKLKK